MRILFFGIIVLIATMMISNSMSSSARVQEAIYNAEQQKQLDAKQMDILASLDAKNDATVSQFVADWRREYPSATTEALHELQTITQRISVDVKSAEQFTLAYHQARLDKLNSTISSLAGGKLGSAKPGL